MPGVIRESTGPGWALVGDAGYFKDPITAHGITDALRDAELLASAIIAGGDGALTAYQEARDDLSHAALRHHRRGRVVCLDARRAERAPSQAELTKMKREVSAMTRSRIERVPA